MGKGQSDSEQQVFEKYYSSPFFYSSILHHHIQYKIQYSIRFQSLAILKSPKRQGSKVFYHPHCECDRLSKENCLRFLIVHSHFTKMCWDQLMPLPSYPLLPPTESTNFLLSHVDLSLDFPWRLEVASVGNILRCFSADADGLLHTKDALLLLPLTWFFTQ